MLSDLASRLGVKENRGTLLIPEICHEDLAEMIGCSRPMISRLVGEMVEAGLIGRSRKQYILLSKWGSRGLVKAARSGTISNGIGRSDDGLRMDSRVASEPSQTIRASGRLPHN